jgi:hypothetical protein
MGWRRFVQFYRNIPIEAVRGRHAIALAVRHAIILIVFSMTFLI